MKENNTFSNGDLSAIRMLYGIPHGHYRVWHNKCSSYCTDKICYCQACGMINGEFWCGWYGKKNT